MTDTPTIYTAHDVPDLLNALPTLVRFPAERVAGRCCHARADGGDSGSDCGSTSRQPHHVEELAELVVRAPATPGRRGGGTGGRHRAAGRRRELLAAIESHLRGDRAGHRRTSGRVALLGRRARTFRQRACPTSSPTITCRSSRRSPPASRSCLTVRRWLLDSSRSRGAPPRDHAAHGHVVAEIEADPDDLLLDVAMPQLRPILQRGLVRRTCQRRGRRAVVGLGVGRTCARRGVGMDLA